MEQIDATGADLERLLTGAGELRARLEAFPWHATALGPERDWPISLRSMVAMVLENRFPMTLWWGPELLHVYNASYVPVLGAKHPGAFARSAPEVWSEIWHILGPQCEAVRGGSGATWNEHLLLPMNRKGFTEETYFTFSYSPVRDDDGDIGGVLVTCQETTDAVRLERQQLMLRDLGAQVTPNLATPTSAEAACVVAAEILASNDADLPFALLYLIDGDAARLVATAGFDAGAAPGRVERIALDRHDLGDVWPLAAAADGGTVIVDDVRQRFGAMPRGRWSRPPERAVVIPLSGASASQRYGFLVAGVSPMRDLDERYMELQRLTASQIFTSIASARAYEKERRRAEALAEIDRAKTAFFSNVSHEFRTPLTLMLGPIEDAIANSEHGLAGGDLHVVHRNTLRLSKLVNALLDFARIEAGRIEASYEPVDLAAWTADLASVFRSAIERAGMELVVDCPPLGMEVHVDREMWEKIVLNLLSNALKFTFAGRIEVSLRRVEGAAVLSVSDTGIGIPAAERERVFDRFHRVRAAGGRTHEGSGIGLALVRELVDLHGGVVEAASAVDVGTTFRVRIPLGSDHLPADRIRAPRHLSSSATYAGAYVQEAMRWLSYVELPAASDPNPDWAPPGPAGAGPTSRVLIVDDNADMREYLARLLGRHWEVTLARHGGEALDLALDDPPDLVLSDVMMPMLDGFGLLRCLRADPRTCDIPVVLLSARAGEEARVEGLQAGADDYLIKPFTARELLARVHGCIVLARSRREAQASLRESRERFRVLVEAAAQAVWEADAEGRFVTDSPSWRAYTGQSLGRWLAGAWLDMVHPDDRDAVDRSWRRALASGRPMHTEYRLRHAEGDWRWTHALAAPIRGADGAVRKWVGMHLDVTERRRAEEALREADRRKDDFLAMLGHELRNPLAAIRNATDLLGLLEAGAPSLANVHGVLDRQTSHMSRLVDGLLEVSRIARGKIRLVTEVLDLRTIVAAVVADRRHEIDAAALNLDWEAPDEVVAVCADRVRIAQVVDNLVGNAIKFTDPGGTLRVAVEVADRRAIVRVIDTGVGIDPSMQRRLFEPFQQEAQELARSAGGLGLGLALVEGLVGLHGGEVRVHSAGRGHGSEFVVELPRTSAQPRAVSGAAAVPGARRRVLVVEDNRDAGTALRDLLVALGHDVALVEDGRRGVEMADAWGPEVVLCDIGLPGMSGYEVARTLRDRHGSAGPRLVAVSGYGQAEDRDRMRQAGFHGHLTKPISSREIHEVLRQLEPGD